MSDYIARISCPDKGILVEAPMPETFQFDLAAHYSPAFSTGTGTISNMLRFVGIRPMVQVMSMQLWMGSSDTELSLDLEFQAEYDAYKEVVEPIMKLKSLVAPQGTVGMTAPGPHVREELMKTFMSTWENYSQGSEGTLQDSNVSYGGTNPQKGAKEQNRFGTVAHLMQYVTNNITIDIGRYASFPHVVVTNIVENIATQPDVNGRPMYSSIQVRFRPLFLLTMSDIEKIFKVGPTLNSPANDDTTYIGIIN